MKRCIALFAVPLLFACAQQTEEAKVQEVKEEVFHELFDEEEGQLEETQLEEAQVSVELEYETYCNERFNQCIEYPKGLKEAGVSQNGDGQSFFSVDKKVEVLFYGSNYMDEFSTLETAYDSQMKQSGKVSYKVKKDNYFVVSGTKNIRGEEFIVYSKTIYRYNEEVGEVLLTLSITYPYAQKKVYDAYCTKINELLIPDKR